MIMLRKLEGEKIVRGRTCKFWWARVLRGVFLKVMKLTGLWDGG